MDISTLTLPLPAPPKYTNGSRNSSLVINFGADNLLGGVPQPLVNSTTDKAARFKVSFNIRVMRGLSMRMQHEKRRFALQKPLG
jgi:hypothetical protein